MNTHEARTEQNAGGLQETGQPGESKPIRLTVNKPTGERPGFFCADKYNCWMTGSPRKKYIS